MRTQYITFAANEVKTFESAGGYFEILSAANDLASIDWITEDGGFSDPWELVKEGVFGYLPFKGFRITNGPTAQTIKVLFGQGSGGNRAAPVSGNVGIVEDPQDLNTLGGFTYSGFGAVTLAAAATGYMHLRNPPASGKKIIVRKVSLSDSAVTTLVMRTIAKSVAITAFPAGGASPVPAGAGSSASLGIIAVGALTGTSYLFEGGNVAPLPAGDRLLSGFALLPGEAITVKVIAGGTGLTTEAQFFWDEVPI